jgi:hypothetical protein
MGEDVEARRKFIEDNALDVPAGCNVGLPAHAVRCTPRTKAPGLTHCLIIACRRGASSFTGRPGSTMGNLP